MNEILVIWVSIQKSSFLFLCWIMEWHYIDDATDEQFDDLTVSALQAKIQAGTFIPTKDTNFWNEDLEDWTTLENLRQLWKPLLPELIPGRRKSTTALSCKSPKCTEHHRNQDGFCHLHRNLADGKRRFVSKAGFKGE